MRPPAGGCPAVNMCHKGKNVLGELYGSSGSARVPRVREGCGVLYQHALGTWRPSMIVEKGCRQLRAWGTLMECRQVRHRLTTDPPWTLCGSESAATTRKCMTSTQRQASLHSAASGNPSNATLNAGRLEHSLDQAQPGFPLPEASLSVCTAKTANSSQAKTEI